MFSSFKRLTSTALTIILLSSPAYAAEINAEGAAALKTLIQTQLDLKKNVQAAAGGAYITEGDLTVEPANGYYAVTFPHTKIKDTTGKIYDIGMIAANVIPGATANEWKAAIAIPTPIKISDAEGKPSGQLDIAKQKAVGIWDTNLNSFVRLDANYDGLTYKDAADDLSATISKVAVKNQLSREANGNLSGPSSGVLTDWVITSNEDNMTATIKEMRFDLSVRDFDPKIAKSFNEQIGALGQSGKQITDKGTSATHDLGIYNMMTTLIGKSSDAFSVKFSLNDVETTEIDEKTKKADGINLDFASLGFDMAGFRAGSVKTGVQLKYTGLNFKDKSDPDADTIPADLNLDLNVNNLPFNKLVDLGRETLAANETNPMAGMNAMMTVPKLLTEATTNITHTFDVASPLYKAKGNGVMNADIAAQQGYTADQTLEVEGIDRIVARVNEKIKKGNAAEAEALQKTLGPLTIMQMVGQKDPANPDLRTYKFVLNKEGQMLLNGSDMSALLGAAPVPEAEPVSPAQ